MAERVIRIPGIKRSYVEQYDALYARLDLYRQVSREAREYGTKIKVPDGNLGLSRLSHEKQIEAIKQIFTRIAESGITWLHGTRAEFRSALSTDKMDVQFDNFDTTPNKSGKDFGYYPVLNIEFNKSFSWNAGLQRIQVPISSKDIGLDYLSRAVLFPNKIQTNRDREPEEGFKIIVGSETENGSMLPPHNASDPRTYIAAAEEIIDFIKKPMRVVIPE